MKNNNSSYSRIFLISNMWPDNESPGFGSFVKNVVNGLTANGHSFTNYALIVGRRKKKKGKLIGYLKFYWNIIKGFYKGNFDTVYIHFPNQAIPILRLLYKFRKPTTVINYHGEDLLYEPGGYTEKLGHQTDQFVSKYANKIIVPSEFFKKIVIERGIATPDRIMVSPSGGIAEDIFFPAPPNSQIPEHFSAQRELKLGFVGRLEKNKGIMDFLNAILSLKNKGIYVKGYIVGYGILKDDIDDFIHSHNLQKYINFVGGLPQHKLGEFYRNLDLFVFPTHYNESLGLTGIEAMACGIPVIGSDVGGIATYLNHGENGLLVAPGEVDRLVESIEHYYNFSEAKREEIRKECITTGQKFYSEQVCSTLSEVFEDLQNKK